MKKLILASAFLFFTLTNFAQRSDKEWFASIGLNTINSIGSKSPINSPSDWAYGIPISLAIELAWESGFAIEQSFTLNKFPEGNEIDGATLEQDYTYTSFDTHAKYYFGRKIFPDLDWLDIYGNAGVGVFSIDETNISANLGGGVLVWIGRRKTLAIRIQSIAKFAFDHKESGIDNNHFQNHIQLMFVF